MFALRSASPGAVLALALTAAPVCATPLSSLRPQETLRISRTGPMEVTHFTFLRGEEGPPRPYAPYAAGATVYLEYAVGGFALNDDDRMNVDLWALTTDPQGMPLHEPWTQTIAQGSDASPLTGDYAVTLPIFCPAGTYEFTLRAMDRVGGTELEAKATVEVEAPLIPPAETLEIRDFGLSLEEGGAAADSPVLEGGGTVYMSCKLFGMELRDDVADIQMEFQVTGPGGDILLDEPEFFHDRDTYVYHPPSFYLPITGHLTIPAAMPPGTYTLRYTARDNLAGEEIVQEGTVVVR